MERQLDALGRVLDELPDEPKPRRKRRAQRAEIHAGARKKAQKS